MVNENKKATSESQLEYQTDRLRQLVAGLVHCCHERMGENARNLGLLQSELDCMRLFGDEKFLTVRGIAQELSVTRSRITKVLNGLEAKGLVVRLDDPSDARGCLIRLTKEGQGKFFQIEDVIKTNHRRLLLELTPEERRNVIAYLEILRCSMESAKARQD